MENLLKLVVPALEHNNEAWLYRQEYVDCKEETIHGSYGLLRTENYESWFNKIKKALTDSLTGGINRRTYFAFVNSKIVGTIQIRETLNDSLYQTGGHIGYGVCPSQRKKGYATVMLALALEECRNIGIEKALVICDENNMASARTIQKNGGILEDKFIEEDGNVLERYWITLNKPSELTDIK